MNVSFSKKALAKLKEDSVNEITISIKTAGGWAPSGAPYLVMGNSEGQDGTFNTIEVEGLKVNVKTCIKSTSNELVVNYGGLFKKVFYITGALEF